MKRIILFALSLLLLVPCEAVAAGGNPQARSRAQKYAEKKSKDTIRAWAQYSGFASMDLESFAAAAARNKLAEAVEVYVETLTANYIDGVKSDKISEAGMAVKGDEAHQRAEGGFKSVADALIRNSRVVMTDRYLQKDGTFVCCAAVEVRIDDIETVIATSKAVRDALESAGVKVGSAEYEKAAKETRKKLDLSNL